MSGHGEKLTRKQEQAIAALLTRRTIEEAAEAVGVSASTLRRWLKNPKFAASYREARRQVVDHALARLQRATGLAISVLMQVMLDQEAPASPRVAAARAVLDYALRIKEIEELEERVSRLEEVLEGSYATQL